MKERPHYLSGFFSIVFFSVVLFTGCDSVTSVDTIAGKYVVFDHCEKKSGQYNFDRNNFLIERIRLSDSFRIYPPTPVEFLNSNVATWGGLVAKYSCEETSHFLIIHDNLTGFWDGKYEVSGESNGDISYLYLESDERDMLLEDVNPLIHTQYVCRGCSYEAVKCDKLQN